MSTIKVHMIGNAHLDPVWLWSYGAGVDEALATAYSAANLLDEFPEFVFTRSDTWFHQIIETLNPVLFERIKAYVAAGRWRLVGGWHVQPDCNLPTEFSFRKHIELGRAYNRDRFGVEVRVGYNVDSFGHAGTLPRFLAEAGYTNYVFMRPGAHEMELPNPVFRWQAADSEHEVVTCRINHAYCHHTVEHLREHILHAVETSDQSLGQVMCFYGVGDHGGGPTRAQIEWILENRNALDGLELVFSCPETYFQAISDRCENLPVVKGELQYHASGCYTSLRRLNVVMRNAEHRLQQAGNITRRLAEFAPGDAEARLTAAWEDALLNQFHDTYGGTCLRSAYPEAFAQIERARATADDLIRQCTRRYSAGQPPVVLSERARAFAAVVHADDEPFQGYITHEYFGLRNKPLRIVDDATGVVIPCQCGDPESSTGSFARVTFPLSLSPGEIRILRTEVLPENEAPAETDVSAAPEGIRNAYWNLTPQPCGIQFANEKAGVVLKLSFQVLHDLSDTWSHRLRRYEGPVLGCFRNSRLTVEESGPVRATLAWLAEFAESRIRVRLRVYANNPWAELEMDLFWAQQKAVLKLVAESSSGFCSRVDGIPGGAQLREFDGYEYPLHDWLLCGLESDTRLGFVSPDIHAVDADSESLRFTLVRSPRYSLHRDDVPDARDPDRFVNDFLDQGEHTYRMLIRLGTELELPELQRLARQLQQPPVVWDCPYRRM